MVFWEAGGNVFTVFTIRVFSVFICTTRPESSIDCLLANGQYSCETWARRGPCVLEAECKRSRALRPSFRMKRDLRYAASYAASLTNWSIEEFY